MSVPINTASVPCSVCHVCPSHSLSPMQYIWCLSLIQPQSHVGYLMVVSVKVIIIYATCLKPSAVNISNTWDRYPFVLLLTSVLLINGIIELQFKTKISPSLLSYNQTMSNLIIQLSFTVSLKCEQICYNIYFDQVLAFTMKISFIC